MIVEDTIAYQVYILWIKILRNLKLQNIQASLMKDHEAWHIIQFLCLLIISLSKLRIREQIMWDQVLKIMDRIIKGKLKHRIRNSKRKYTFSQDMNSFCISPYFINIVPVYALMTKKLFMQKYSKSLSIYLNKVCIWSLMSYINTVESDLSDEDQQIMNKFKATKYNNVTFSKDKSSRKSSFNRRKSSNGIFDYI